MTEPVAATPPAEPSLKEVRPRAQVLRDVMALRYAALRRSSGSPAIASRHDRFLHSSPSYRRASAPGPAGRAAARETVTIGGVAWSLPADARRENGIADRMLRSGWLPFADILLARELAVGRGMIDIGANIGTTCVPRVVLGDFQFVYAAEPEPANYAALVDTVSANGLGGLVMPDQVAIGDRDGEDTLLVSSKMTNHALARGGQVSDAGEVRVPCRTLDSWVREHGIDLNEISFIKCDTQGGEGYVFRGAANVLAHQHIAWHIEFWPKGLRKAAFDRDELFHLLRTHFTHFMDLSTGLKRRAHVRPTAKLAKDLADVGGEERGTTDLLLYNAIG